MKGGKDEEKTMEPLFPRLHVNDKEKGGPRAPPRNKMALYEQLSAPSQRFNSSASSSSAQAGAHERNVFSSFYAPPPTLAHSADKFLFDSADGVNLNAAREELERKSSKNSSCKMLKNVAGTSLPAAECSSLRPQNISNSRSSCDKKLGDEDDFMVPTYDHSEIPPYSSEDQRFVDIERSTPFCAMNPSGPSTITAANSSYKSASASCNYSIQHQNALGNSLEQTNWTDLKSRQHGRNWSEKPKEAVTAKEHREMSTGEHFSEPSKYTKTSSIQQHFRGSVDDLESLRNRNTRLGRESSAGLMAEDSNYGAGISVEPRGFPGGKVTGNGSVSRVWIEPCSRIPTGSEDGSEECEGTTTGSLQLQNIDRNDDGSETSIVDSISGSEISPDDVVGIIGQKHFWKARRAIVNQQRVFAVQVFELHRLIKVQKLIAGSPHLLAEENPRFSGPPKVPSKELPSEYILKSQPKMAKQDGVSQKPFPSIECPTEDEVVTAASALDDGIKKGVVSIYGPYGNPLQPIPMAPENKANPWCLQPAGNQWLVPVMSPSEGLVYKPYTGSCVPTAGFMAPVYGGFGPLCLPPATGDFMNMAYGVPAHQQQGMGVFSATTSVAPNYFPHYGLPVVNSIVSAPAVEQVNQLSGARSRVQVAEQLSMGDVNLNMQSQRSCNVSNQKSEAFSCGVKKFQRSKDSELQGSTGSSPFERVQGATGRVTEGATDPLTLFPMAQPEGLGQPPKDLTSDQRTHVIKVVPHNRRSANESAARIFRSIQKERQQYD